MKLIVAGGRDFSDFNYGFSCINHMLKNTPLEDVTIICGKASGGDTCGEEFYKANKHLGVKILYFIPEWGNIDKPCAVIKTNRYGKPYNAKAGMDRNHKMGDEATHLIAFWDGKSRGTKDMITYMERLKKPVKIFKY